MFEAVSSLSVIHAESDHEGSIWVRIRIRHKCFLSVNTFCSCHVINKIQVNFIHRVVRGKTGHILDFLAFD